MLSPKKGKYFTAQISYSYLNTIQNTQYKHSQAYPEDGPVGEVYEAEGDREEHPGKPVDRDGVVAANLGVGRDLAGIGRLFCRRPL